MADLVAWLEDVYLAGSAATTAAGLAAAHEFALRRAGDLVGLHFDAASGLWEEAVNPAYRIGDDIRRAIHDAVAEGIGRGDSAGTIRASLDGYLDQAEGRALMVARTEMTRDYNMGTVAAGVEDGVELWDVSDGPGCLPDGHDDSADLPDPDVVGVQADRQADGQRWTSEEAAMYPAGHPCCVRDFSPVVPGD